MNMITAHSGCDNTVDGSEEYILTAIKNGADCIELDLRLFNGEVLISHDPINKSHLSSYLNIYKAIDIIKSTNIKINCDIKEEEVFEPALRIFKEKNIDERIIFTGSFKLHNKSEDIKHSCFINVENMEIEQIDGVLTYESAEKVINKLESLKNEFHISGINVDYTRLSDEAVLLFHKNKIKVSCWTVDDKDDLVRILKYNLYNITTNNVYYLYQLMKGSRYSYEN